jgi:hypothetical protein
MLFGVASHISIDAMQHHDKDLKTTSNYIEFKNIME